MSLILIAPIYCPVLLSSLMSTSGLWQTNLWTVTVTCTRVHITFVMSVGMIFRVHNHMQSLLGPQAMTCRNQQQKTQLWRWPPSSHCQVMAIFCLHLLKYCHVIALLLPCYCTMAAIFTPLFIDGHSFFSRNLELWDNDGSKIVQPNVQRLVEACWTMELLIKSYKID